MTSRSTLRDATRVRVLTCAERLFEERGFAATTVREIAAEAGVSTGTVMGIGDKNGLLVAVFDERIRRLHDDFPEPAQPRTSSPADEVEAVVALFQPFIDLFGAHPELARTYGAVLVSGQHGSVVFSELRERLLGELRDVFTPVAHRSPGDAEEFAATAYLAYLGALLEWASTPEADTAALTDRVHRAMRPLLAVTRRDTGR